MALTILYRCCDSNLGSKTELKQRLVEHLEKEGEDLSVLEFEYNIGGREQTDNLEGEDGASVSNTVVRQCIQQQMQQQMQQTQQQTQRQTKQQMQRMQQQGQQIESKIDIVQENQRILQTHIDETYQQFEGKVNVLEEKVDNVIGQLDARINAQEKDVKNEIKALKKELAKLQTNNVTTSSTKTSAETTFTETLGFALTQEAASVLWTSGMRARRTEVSSESDISNVVCAAVRQVQRENKRMRASKTRKCYACQKPGHLARECRSKHKESHSTSPTRSISEGASEISNKLKRISTAEQRLTPKFSSHRVGITQSKRSNSSLTTDGKIQGCNYIITLDAGASHSIINSTVVTEKFDPYNGRGNTGDGFYGKARLRIRYEKASVTIRKRDFATVGYDRQAEVLQVVVQRQQKIPPKSEAIVWATTTQEIRLSKIWVVEPSKECVKDNIFIGKAVVSSVNNLIPVRVLNNKRYNKSSKRGYYSAMPESRIREIDEILDFNSRDNNQTE
uniref:CCHC-type domain-containing protein n=1 Tax=Glossina austeni TaxID=7395 RepID=A0A1A9VGU2_GLOAU